MKRTLSALTTGVILLAATGVAQSPPATAEATINGKKISIKYGAPSVRGRKIFGKDGLIAKDRGYPVWRAGANEATTLTTDADLMIGSLHVPKGTYTLFVDTAMDPWQLIVSKETGQWGLAYKKQNDLGRVPMKISKPAAPVEQLKYTITGTGGSNGKLELAWENVVASVDLMVH